MHVITLLKLVLNLIQSCLAVWNKYTSFSTAHCLEVAAESQIVPFRTLHRALGFGCVFID